MDRVLRRLAARTVARLISRGSHIILLALVLVSSISPAALAACEISPKGEIHVAGEPEMVNVGTHFSLGEIAGLAKAAGRAGNDTPLGFYTSRLQYAVSVAIEMGPEALCTKHVRIDVNMQLVDRRLEIGQEVERQPCQFVAALHHYERKAKADETVFERYVLSTATMLGGTALPVVSISADDTLDATVRTQIEQWVKTLVEQGKESFNSERVAAVHGVDTPDEMQRLALACTKGI